MLTQEQYRSLTLEQQVEYDNADEEGKTQFEYFYGFTFSSSEFILPTNQELELYRSTTDSIQLKTVAQLLGFTPHRGQQPIFYTFDVQKDIINNIVMVLGRRAQTLDSKILTPNGYVTFKDVQPNQVILNPNGGTQTVTEVHPIYDGEVYEVTLGGTHKCKVDSQHLFSVIDSHGRTRVLDVEHIAKYYKAPRKNSHYRYNKNLPPMTHEYKYKVLNVKPLDLPKQDVPIDPYVLGLLLGDGSTCTSAKKVLKDRLKDLGLFGTKSDTKFIPDIYLKNDVWTRLEVLRGLMDTDGHCRISKKTTYVEYCTVSEQLCNGVIELVESLGGNYTLSTKIGKYKKDGKTHVCKKVYRLFIYMELNPFKIKRKADVFIPRRNLYKYITDIKYLGKEPVRCISVSAEHQCYITDNYIRTHNTGKSAQTSVIAIRELLVPYSSTILLTPTFNNARIIFNEVLKHVQKLKLTFKSINKGAFRFELENGARFSANSESNIESALGSYNSLLIVDETQSFQDLESIVQQMLVPTLLDYGSRPSGILYGRQIYLGTPRGTDNYLYDLFIKEEQFPNWKSFNAPSTTNPILPKSYFEQMRLELGEMLYRQEILAEFIGSGDNVFWAFNKELNLYERGSVVFSKDTPIISGIDIGARDSTSQVWLYRTPDGSYYLDRAYSQNMTSTSSHIENYHREEAELLSVPEMRYIDPSAAQIRIDYLTDYDYECFPGANDVQESIKYINLLLTPTGANNKPKLYICSDLVEVIRQMSRVMWKTDVAKTSRDPFVKDPKGTHWDLIAAIRYALYTDRFNTSASMVISSSSSSNKKTR